MVIGLPATLSYSGVNLSVFGMKILDVMDETVGTLSLPITALLTSVVFTWFFKKKVLAQELEDSKQWFSMVLLATKYVIPAVLIITTALKIILSFDIGALHFVPGIEFIGSVAQMAQQG